MSHTWTLTLRKKLNLACFTSFLLSMTPSVFSQGNVAHKNQHATAFVALEATQEGPRLIHVDKSDLVSVFYQLPKRDRLHQFYHHPRNSSLIMAYSEHRSGKQGVFTLNYSPDDASAPHSLLPMITDEDPATWLFDPVMTPDGKTLFYVSAQNKTNSKRASQNLKLIRYSVENGETELVGLEATSPSLSENGKYLSWLEGNKKILVLDLYTNQTKEFNIPNPKRRIRFPMMNEQHSLLHLFTNESRLATQIPFLKSAWAHPGKKHEDAYGWQFKLSEPKIQNTEKTMEIKDLKSTDMHKSGKLAYLDETGLHLYSMDSKETESRFAHHHLWMFRFTTE